MQRWTIDSRDHGWNTDRQAGQMSRALLSGELVAIPTETVYGLAADATNPQACARIFEVKGRPQFNPLISHVDCLETAERHGVFDATARKLAQAFWPGPLTIVVPRKPGSPVCDLVTAGLDTLALRVPAGPVMRFMAQETGRPIAAPSANKSGKISPTRAQDVADDLGGDLRFLIDAGPCPVGVESTIVSVVDGSVRLLRAGGVERAALQKVLADLPLSSGPASNDTNPQAPGMLTSHYAPAAKLVLNADHIEPGDALLAFGATLPANASAARLCLNLSETGDLREAAANLFSHLRRLDATGASTIRAQSVPNSGLGEAINDRLRRAAAPR
ncbi:L-threonylcarbamoyladenylate synthase [Roseibium sp. RKSG952]|uniref:L-threonylcarbamoyladenylate synthase n=1 Tax=Roseibium sp. RKSG952 TaxID=2529384 RepID=UPI0012BC5033|nr:L-threonylcarbamoyladenylate synthase [Roseibium sp. RKSG952]MTH96110.1 threonylcarbamoyl-AMP synthase [Roseibium sp. RKSG952]